MGLNYSFNSSWSYTFKKKLGSGGSAEIFLYTRCSEGLPDENVVLKILKNEDPSKFPQLLNEGRKLCELRHPNILKTFGYERVSPGRFGLVLEYINGSNLSELIPIIKSNDRLQIAAYVVRNTAQALIAAHSHKIIHGDLSSRNILVCKTGSIKLSDFGEARNFGTCHFKKRLKGSLDYLAPERWLGAPTSTASDIFALGVFAFEILSGTNPLRTKTRESGRRALQRFLINKPWTEFKEWLEFFNKSLTENPNDRVEGHEIIRSIPYSFGGREKLRGYVSQGSLHCKVETVDFPSDT